jgi:hypothetical protein
MKKLQLSKEDNAEEPNIKKLLDEEIKKASEYFFPPEEKEHIAERKKFVREVVDEVCSRLKGSAGGFFVFNGLRGLLVTKSIEPYFANQIFNKIYSEFKYEKKMAQSDKSKASNYELLLFETKQTAIGYFKYVFYSELKGRDLPEKLKLIKRTLAEATSSDDEFRRQALIEIQEVVESEIEIKKEELLIRQQLNISNGNPKEKVERVKHEDLNIETATLFMTYLFDYVNLKCEFTKKAELIEFLTGFSKKQIVKLPSEFEKFKLDIEVGDEVNKIFVDNMQIVRKYFQKLRLFEVVERIDKELGN